MFPVPTRNRDAEETSLWWGLYLLLSFAWTQVIPASRLAWDFPQFYIAGNLSSGETYNRSAVLAFASAHLAPLGVSFFPPYVRPAIFSLPLTIFRHIPYWTAFWLWAISAFAAYSLAVHLLLRSLSLPSRLLPAFALFYPAQYGTITGQDIGPYVLVLVLSFLSLNPHRQAFVGGLLSLCLYKFNLAIAFPALLLLHGRKRALAVFGCASLLLVSISISMAPVSDYLTAVRMIPIYSPNLNYRGLHGIAQQFDIPMLWYYFAVALTLVACAWFARRMTIQDGFCVALIALLLCSYHSMWYDVAVLILPIAAAWNRSSPIGKAILILILVTPPLPVFFTPPFHVACELYLLAWFFRHSNSHPRSNLGVPTQAQNPATIH